MTGWIKLHRKISESAVFSDPDLLRLWILCLTKATHKGTSFLIDRQQISLLPGEFVTGRKSLTDEYNLGLKPRNRKKELSIWRDLKFLEECGNVNIKSTNKYSVVSISKWCEYQETEQQQNNNRTTDEQQLNTNKNVKNDKEIYIAHFEEFWKLYPSKKGKAKAQTKWITLSPKMDFEKVIEGTKAYITFIEHGKAKGKNREYKDGATFVNQESWNDDWTIQNEVSFKPTNKQQSNLQLVKVTDEDRKELHDAYNKIQERNGVSPAVNS